MSAVVLKCDCGFCKTCKTRQRMQYLRGRRRDFEPSKRQEILDQAATNRARKEALSALLRGEPVTMPPPMPRRRRSSEVLEELRRTVDKLTSLLAELSA